jgi:hypothetical protein
LSVGDVSHAISEARPTLNQSTSEDTLIVNPAKNATPDLAAGIGNHKLELLTDLREDEEMRRTGITQTKRQVFELTRRVLSLGERDTT